MQNFELLNTFTVDSKFFLFDGNSSNSFTLSSDTFGIVTEMILLRDPSLFDLLDKYIPNSTINNKSKIAKSNVLKKISINLSSKCNLNCVYCWNHQGSYYGDKNPSNISKEVVDKVIYLLPTCDLDWIDLFGGEPLLNKPIVYHLFDKLSQLKKRIGVSLTTNGTLIDQDICKLLSAYKRIDLTISLDGDKFTHDLNRPYCNGMGSYNVVISNLKMLDKYKIPYFIRSTLGKGLLNYTDVAKHHIEHNFNNFQISYSSNSISEIKLKIPALSYETNYLSYMLFLLEEFRKTKKLYYDLAMSMRKFLFFRKITANNKCLSAGCTSIGINTFGDIYPCEIMIDIPGAMICNISELKSTDDLINNKFEQKVKKMTIDKCVNCWLKPKCINCYAKNHFDGNEINEPDEESCLIYKIEAKIAIYIISLLSPNEKTEILSRLGEMYE